MLHTAPVICGLYVNEPIANRQVETTSIPERRPPPDKRKAVNRAPATYPTDLYRSGVVKSADICAPGKVRLKSALSVKQKKNVSNVLSDKFTFFTHSSTDLSLPVSGANIKTVIENLSKALQERQILRIKDAELRISAVLVPVFLKKGQYHLLFIQRTERVKYHKGQISFPGGAYEKKDGLILNTALREADEEIGLVRRDVQILGELDDVLTATSNYIISPFVGLIPYPYDFRPDKWETEELLEIPIADLQDKTCFSEGVTEYNGVEVETYFYQYGERSIWGATAKILKQFLEIYSRTAVP